MTYEKIYFEIDKQQVKSKKEAHDIALKRAKEDGYRCEIINNWWNNCDDNWQHPDRLKNKWVFVFYKGDDFYRICPHGKGYFYRGTSLVPKCFLCRTVEDIRLKEWAKEQLNKTK